MKRKLLFIFIIIFNLTGCASLLPYPKREEQLTSLQERAMEAKELEGTFDDAFRATLSVLQDKSYDIKNSDYQAGIISAIASVKVQCSGKVVGMADDTANITVEKFTENRVKIRLSIYRQFHDIDGNKLPGDLCQVVANVHHNVKCTDLDTTGVIDAPEVYQDFYAEIQQEMFRREQLNK